MRSRTRSQPRDEPAEVARQVGQLYPLAVGGVESFDQCLLALDAPQDQMPIAGRCGEDVELALAATDDEHDGLDSRCLTDP